MGLHATVRGIGGQLKSVTAIRAHIAGLRVALVHMIGFEDMAQVHSVRVALTHMVVAGMVATVPVRR